MTQVAVGNQIWSYQEIGTGNGTPILILHGWGRSGNEWIRMATDLSIWSKRCVYVVDLPGFGGSSLPKVKTIGEYSELVKDFCKYLEIDQIILVGHSLGGRIGIVLGATFPQFIERLVLVDPAGVKPRSLKRVILKSIAALFRWIPSGVRAKFVGKLMDEDYRNSPALRNLYRAVVGEDLKKYLPHIRCKTVLAWGEHDLILPLSLTSVYRRMLKDNKIRVVWGAGHDPHLTEYDQTLSIMQEAVE
jgi:pimeloyl-ACP methyl ester carboxylesterase